MSNNKAILIVDDEFIILESLRIQISRILPETILLEAASSGEESFQVIDDFYDNGNELVLVISDFHLDDVKGTEILKYAVQKYPQVQKAILTGQADVEQIKIFQSEFGETTTLSKPWDFSDIQNMITPFID